VVRAPQQPLIQLPSSYSDLTQPVYGHLPLRPSDNDLTRQCPAGEPQGERIIVAGRVVDEDSRPQAGVLIELIPLAVGEHGEGPRLERNVGAIGRQDGGAARRRLPDALVVRRGASQNDRAIGPAGCRLRGTAGPGTGQPADDTLGTLTAEAEPPPLLRARVSATLTLTALGRRWPRALRLPVGWIQQERRKERGQSRERTAVWHGGPW
jgi:hypothetical protein